MMFKPRLLSSTSQGASPIQTLPYIGRFFVSRLTYVDERRDAMDVVFLGTGGGRFRYLHPEALDGRD